MPITAIMMQAVRNGGASPTPTPTPTPTATLLTITGTSNFGGSYVTLALRDGLIDDSHAWAANSLTLPEFKLHFSAAIALRWVEWTARTNGQRPGKCTFYSSPDDVTYTQVGGEVTFGTPGVNSSNQVDSATIIDSTPQPWWKIIETENGSGDDTPTSTGAAELRLSADPSGSPLITGP